MLWMLGAIIFILFGYIYALRKQVRSIDKQLQIRASSDVTSPVQLQLFDRQLNELVAKLNDVLASEQKTRFQSREEQQYYKEMISNISHDFRTPLTAVKGYQQLLLKEQFTVEQRDKLLVAQSHVLYLEKLLETFFEYSYLLSQRDEPMCTIVRLDVIVEEFVAGYYTQFEDKGIAVDIISSGQDVLLSSDEGMLRRIVQNLLQNALQHSHYDVCVRLWQDKDFTYVSVENRVDDVEGMSPEQLFDRFFTNDQSRRRSSGLGLSIVRLLSERLGGSAVAILTGNMLTFTVKILNEEKRASS